jgi:hypothetical protein
LFSQPSSGNCNLFVLMLFPLGPAFKIAYIWFWISFISHVINYHHNHIFFLLGVFRLLVGTLGRSVFLMAGVCRGVRRIKKSSEIRAQAVTVHQTWFFFQHSKSNLGWILRCPHPGSWVLGPKSWSPAGNT